MKMMRLLYNQMIQPCKLCREVVSRLECPKLLHLRSSTTTINTSHVMYSSQ